MINMTKETLTDEFKAILAGSEYDLGIADLEYLTNKQLWKLESIIKIELQSRESDLGN